VGLGVRAAVDDADFDVARADVDRDLEVAAGQGAGVSDGVGDQFGRAHQQVVAAFVGDVGERFAQPPADQRRGACLVRDPQPLGRRYRSWHVGSLPPGVP
jgi:hypothetical protein